MAIHWQIQFRSLRAQTLYTVNVYDDNYTGTPVQLTGGSVPFSTEEDNGDEDIFEPVRGQSGYIRIVDTGVDNNGVAFNWMNMIPSSDMSNYVELLKGSDVAWCGYMQATNFSGEMYNMPLEREFPVNGLLDVLSVKDFAVDGGIITIAAVINEIFRDVPVRSYWFQNTNVLDWITKKIDSSVFGELVEDESTHVYSFKSSYNRKEVLVHLCTYFGFACRQVGQDIFFNFPNSSYDDYVVIGKSDLNDDGTCSHIEQDFRSTVVLDPVFVSTDNSEEYKRGIRKVTVTADIGKDESVVEIPMSEIDKRYADNPVQIIPQSGDLYLFSKLDTSSDFWTFDNGLVYIVADSNTTEAHGIGGGTVNIEEWYHGNLADKHNFNLSTYFVIHSTIGPQASDPLITIIGLQAHNYQYGVLAINAVINTITWSWSGDKVSDRTTTPTTDALICRMRIGIWKGNIFEGSYWNGQSWQAGECTFRIPVKDGRIDDNRVLTSNAPAYTGYGAIVNGNVMGGQYQLQIVGIESSSLSNRVDLEISDLKVNFYRYGVSERGDSKNVYSEETGMDFVDDVDIDNIIATDNNNSYGKGILLNSDGSYCDGIIYGINVKVKPELKYIRSIILQKNVVRKNYYIDIYDQDGITPQNVYELKGSICYPTVIRHNWRDDQTSVTLTEIQTTT